MKANTIFDTLSLLEKYCDDKKKLKHSIRVAQYAREEAMYRNNIDTNEAYVVGLAHDIIEDTDCPPEELQKVLGDCLMSSVWILTKDDNETYEEYIDNIFVASDPLAILVKRADMKDHLTQKATLTDKLKEKYLPVIHRFL